MNNELEMNWREANYRDICPEGLKNIRKPSVRIVGVAVDIRTEHLPNTSIHSYTFGYPPRSLIFMFIYCRFKSTIAETKILVHMLQRYACYMHRTAESRKLFISLYLVKYSLYRTVL
jgi:hypothetical protein